VVVAQKKSQLKREQEAAEEAKRDERRMAIWFGGIVAAIILFFVFCVAVSSPHQYKPHWSDGVSDTSNAKQAPWLRGFSDSEKETILQESYLFDVAAKQLEKERD